MQGQNSPVLGVIEGQAPFTKKKNRQNIKNLKIAITFDTNLQIYKFSY